jgi:hypothetical protein
MKQWHALEGKGNEIIFRQRQQPGQQALVDFTVLKNVIISIAGAVLNFRLHHSRLTYCKWSHLKIVQGGESYTALTEGTSEALKCIGAAPAE